jgi:short-subunit dehydrogenase
MTKTILLTGASLGFGKLTAFNLAKEKAHLALTYYKDEKEAREVEKKCKELGAQEVLMIKLDVKDSKNIQNVVSQVIKKFKSIDFLINNAGIVIWKNFEDQTENEIEDQLNTNLLGLIKMTKFALPNIKEMIINVASEAALEGYGELSTYCASKFGVRGFTQALAYEQPKIKIYCVNPGAYATRMNNFKGRNPQEVADLILDLVNGKINKRSGSDINIGF